MEAHHGVLSVGAMVDMLEDRFTKEIITDFKINPVTGRVNYKNSDVKAYLLELHTQSTLMFVHKSCHKNLHKEKDAWSTNETEKEPSMHKTQEDQMPLDFASAKKQRVWLREEKTRALMIDIIIPQRKMGSGVDYIATCLARQMRTDEHGRALPAEWVQAQLRRFKDDLGDYTVKSMRAAAKKPNGVIKILPELPKVVTVTTPKMINSDVDKDLIKELFRRAELSTKEKLDAYTLIVRTSKDLTMT